MGAPIRHAATLTPFPDGIYLECSCGELLGTYNGSAPYSDVNGRVMVHSFQILSQAFSAALAPILNQPKRRDFKLVPPPMPPLRLSRPENEE